MEKISGILIEADTLMAGFSASLAAIMSGFTANILIVMTDVLLSGITTQAAKMVDPNIAVTPIDNWYFMSFSVLP